MIKPFAGWSGWHCLTWKSACKKKKLANSKDFKASNRIRWIHGLNTEKSPISCFASWTACVLRFKSEESQPQVYAECHGSRQLVMNQIMNFIEWLKAAATSSRTSHQKTCQTMCTAVFSTFHCRSPAKGVTTWFRSDAPSLHQSVALPVATRAKPISYSSLHLSIYKNSSIIQWQLRLNAITMCYNFCCLSICDICSADGILKLVFNHLSTRTSLWHLSTTLLPFSLFGPQCPLPCVPSPGRLARFYHCLRFCL